jgi:hypothetical protein
VLEDLFIWTMEKVKSTKKGSRTHVEAALQKARAMKTEALGVKR